MDMYSNTMFTILCTVIKSTIIQTVKYVNLDHVFNPLSLEELSPHDALEHHFTSLKTDLISLQPRVLKRKFP